MKKKGGEDQDTKTSLKLTMFIYRFATLKIFF